MNMNDGVNPFGETRGKRRSYRSMIIRLARAVQHFMMAVPVKRRRALLASNPIKE
jgi:hypothetical protein